MDGSRRKPFYHGGHRGARGKAGGRIAGVTSAAKAGPARSAITAALKRWATQNHGRRENALRDADGVNEVGVLRVRRNFAKRNFCFAQDDRAGENEILRFAQEDKRIGLERTSSFPFAALQGQDDKAGKNEILRCAQDDTA